MKNDIPDKNLRIKEVIQHFSDGNVSKFASMLDGISQQQLSRLFLKDKRGGKYPGVSEAIISSIVKNLPINPTWLLTGNEQMLLTSDSETPLQHAPPGRLPKRHNGSKVRFYDVDFAAGDIEFYDDNNSITPAYEMDIPDFNGCTAFRTYGDSMEKMIKSGSIVFGTRIEDWRSHLEYGQIYGIVCTDGRKYMKSIRKAKEQETTHFLLHSENPEYDDFLIPKEKIKSIWLIHGWLNKKV